MSEEVQFRPPPVPSVPPEPWKEFMARLEKYTTDSPQATPSEFLKQVGGTPEHPLVPLKSLRNMLNKGNQTFLPSSPVVGVVTRKFHVRFWEKETSSGCSVTLWLRDSTDLVRVTMWDNAAHTYYDKFHEGMLVTILGFKIKPLYRHEKELAFEVAKLSPVEINMSSPIPLSRGSKGGKLLTIDLHSVWNYDVKKGVYPHRPFLSPFTNFEFGPESLKCLADSPISLDFRRSLVARVVYKSSVRHYRTYQGGLPYVWLALCDGSLEGTELGSGRKEHVWLFLGFNYQAGLLEQLSPNQLVVVTYVASLYLFNEDWQEVLEWKLICHSTNSTQVHIVSEEPDSRVWHYLRSVVEQKSPPLVSHVKSLARSFGDVPPEVSHVSPTETLFKQGTFVCEYKHS